MFCVAVGKYIAQNFDFSTLNCLWLYLIVCISHFALALIEVSPIILAASASRVIDVLLVEVTGWTIWSLEMGRENWETQDFRYLCQVQSWQDLGSKARFVGHPHSGGKKVTGRYAAAAQLPMAASALQPRSASLYHFLQCYQILWDCKLNHMVTGPESQALPLMSWFYLL